MSRLHEQLWSSNRDLAAACRHHPFVVGLENGTLDSEAFRAYVGQDAFFLRAFARGYALAAARSTSDDDLATFHRLLGGVIAELETHRHFSRELGIDLENIDPFPETLAYTEFLDRHAWEGSLDVILAAMTPCMRLYAYLGTALATNGIPDHPFAAWIETYASEEFQSLADELESRLDRLAEDEAAVRDAYARAMTLEYGILLSPPAVSGLRAGPEGGEDCRPAAGPLPHYPTLPPITPRVREGSGHHLYSLCQGGKISCR